MTPTWTDGEPSNALAAMMDAREWLVVLRKMSHCGRAQFVAPAVSLPALERCIDALDASIAYELAKEAAA